MSFFRRVEFLQLPYVQVLRRRLVQVASPCFPDRICLNLAFFPCDQQHWHVQCVRRLQLPYGHHSWLVLGMPGQLCVECRDTVGLASIPLVSLRRPTITTMALLGARTASVRRPAATTVTPNDCELF